MSKPTPDEEWLGNLCALCLGVLIVCMILRALLSECTVEKMLPFSQESIDNLTKLW